MEKRCNKKNLLSDIGKEKPSPIYLTGKTCTGKTTLLNEFVSIGYRTIVLDEIILNSIVNKYHVRDVSSAFTVLRGEARSEWQTSFIQATRHAILSKLKHNLIIVEGSLANNEILKKIFSGKLENFSFIFLLPTDVFTYRNRIQKRFIAEVASGIRRLPESFYHTINETDIKEYLDTQQINNILSKKIENFAMWSTEESQRRLNYFRQLFSDIIVVEV